MSMLRPLRDPATRLLWGGLALSAIGDQAYAVAMSWITVDLFGAYAGWLVALGPFALLVTALFGGGWADRWSLAGAMIGSDLLRAAILVAVVAAWSWSGQPSATGLVLAVMTLGAAQAVFRPALQATLPALVPDRAILPAANALLDATERVARLVGPALAGVLSGVIPIRHLLTLDAATFVASALAIAGVNRIRRLPPGHVSAREGHPLASVLRGARAARRHPLLRYVLSTTAVVNGAWYGVFFLVLPIMVAQDGLIGPGGTGLGAYGLIISAYGCTNLAANLVVGSRGMPVLLGRQVFIGTCCTGAGIVFLAAAQWLLPPALLLPGLMLSASLSAFGGPMQDIPLAVVRQTEIASPDIAAATRAFMAANQGGSLLAMLVLPAALSVMSAASATALCGGAIVAVGAGGFARGLARPTAPPAA